MGLAASTLELLDYSWARVRGRLDGLVDQEHLWEPVAGCWSVRERTGRWLVDLEDPEPHPAPLTTIAWRTWHIGSSVLDGFFERATGTRSLQLQRREWFPDAGSTTAALDAVWSAFGAWAHGFDDGTIAVQLGPSFGPYADASWADLLLHVADEVIHHGAEVALLRDLYRETGPVVVTR